MAGGEPPIPEGMWAKVRWTLTYATSWMVPLVAIERFADEHYFTGWVLTGIFLVNLFVVSAWERIVAWWGKARVTALFMILGISGALALGVAIGGLIVGRVGLNSQQQPTGRIEWNFAQMENGQANFLNMMRLNQDEIRVVGIGIHGKNNSNDPITGLQGYVRSDLTNARMPFFIMAEEPKNASAIPNPFEPAQIPTRPEETFGIPSLADFDLVTFEGTVMTQGVDGVPLSQFLREFGSFTLVLEYDGLKIERKFSNDVIRKAITTFENSVNPQRTNIPRVTRRPSASPPPQPQLPIPLPAPTPTPPNDSAHK